MPASGMPYTIVRGTQLFEFIADLVDDATDGRSVPVAAVPVQPVAAADVARVIACVALGALRNSVIEVAGSERLGLDVLARRVLAARHDDREVVPAAHARYPGAELEPGEGSLLPDLVVAETTVAQWLSQNRRPGFLTAARIAQPTPPSHTANDTSQTRREADR